MMKPSFLRFNQFSILEEGAKIIGQLVVWVKPELLREEEYAKIIEKGSAIQREVAYARYPLKVGGRWLTPMGYYTREKPKKSLTMPSLL